MSDTEWMQIAVDLAKNGLPAPNPHVGCIIVKDKTVVGQGFHAFAGGPHAEIEALMDAGELARGADVYCTLEPCNHFGRTGPCSEALISAGVKRVIYAVADPNPQATGGSERLREAGIDSTHLPYQAAVDCNQQFLFAMAHQRPLVTVKYATTLDGAIATSSGQSQWITSQTARDDAQMLRAECGAVLVGRKTAELDRARLNVRGKEIKNQPLRIVLDQHSSLAKDLPIFDSSAPTWHVTSEQPVWNNGTLDVDRFLRQLFTKGINGVLVEGGAKTIAAFFEADRVDRIIGYVAPKVFGGGTSPVADFGVREVADARDFVFESIRTIGPDIKWSTSSRNLCNWRSSYHVEANKA